MKHYLSTCILVLALCACTKTNFGDEAANSCVKGTSIGVSLSDASKTAILSPTGNQYPAVWSEGDCISIGGISSLPLTKAQAGQDKAVFKFEKDISLPFNIIYPASDKADRVLFAPSQAFLEGTFDKGAAPMYGATKEFGDISLKHLSGVLRFLVKAQAGHEEKITKIIVSSLGAEPLCGSFKMSVSPDGLLTGDIAGQSGCASSVILDCGEGVSLSQTAAREFFVCVPCGTYSKGFKVIFIDDSSQAMTLYFLTDSKEAVSIKAGSVKEFPEKEFKAEESIFVINTEKELKDFAAAPSTYTKVVLGKDITVSGEWTPIAGFTGDFDGSMHTISGLNDSFFGDLTGGVVRNLNLASDVSKCSAGSFASLASTLSENGRLVNCHFIGTMNAGLPADVSQIGGLVGRINGAQAKISGCTCSGTVNATYSSTGSVYFGSIVAYATAGTVENCSFSGTLTMNGSSKNAFIGGIGGRCQEGASIINCENKGIVASGEKFSTGSLCFFGGIAGYYMSDISKCTNSGTVECKGSNVTGLSLGGVTGASCNGIEESINNGNVILSAATVTNTTYVGGVVGQLDKASSLKLSGLKSTQDASVTVNSPKSASCICEGGILGSSNLDELEISNCVNEGTVETNGACATYAPGLLMGGIMGGSIRTTPTVLTMYECINKGTIHIEEDKNSSNVVFTGGIIGLAASGAKDMRLTLKMHDCHNEADITRMVNNMVFKSNDRTFCGGICGAIGGDNRNHGTYDNVNAVVSSCSNSGKIVFNRFCGEKDFRETVLNESYSGGIAGVTNCTTGYTALIENCENSGDILSTAGYSAGIVAFSNLGTRICGTKAADGITFTKNSGTIGMFNPDNVAETGGGYLLSGGICACLKESSYAISIEYCLNEGLVAASSDGKIGAGGIVADLRINNAVYHCKNNGTIRFMPSSRCSESKSTATGQISGKGSDFKVHDCAVGGRYGRKANVTAGLDKFGGDERYLFSKFIYALSDDITTQDQLDVLAPGCTWWDGVSPADWEYTDAK